MLGVRRGEGRRVKAVNKAAVTKIRKEMFKNAYRISKMAIKYQKILHIKSQECKYQIKMGKIIELLIYLYIMNNLLENYKFKILN